ncbi:hypothetical protein [Alkaliphilus peptidifermentans]|uniref:Uncharacterized protein n=1 Tax=Alkaliphilus peptidifermentans DSM 18978 TaxID=1120976 RepID=A0A1G5H0U1_9FIRM|nr:hypothetical protein [Alkaliphilus peptidifermentans]SCY57169.1 hypothetical protein SAMN03080606_01857 [Alkaliphilus peptidifermentans DSM 18978]
MLTIELEEDVYREIQKKAKERGLSVTDYIVRIMKEEEDIMMLKSMIIKDLNFITQKLNKSGESFGKENYKSNEKRIIIYSLKNYINKNNEIYQRVKKYRKYNWFNEELFFLIMDKKKVVGCIGISKEKEVMPLGCYLFIYDFQLMEEYITKDNLIYINRFIKAIAKKEKYYSIDISSLTTKISEKVLISLGFIRFYSTDILKIVVKERQPDFSSNYDFKLVKDTEALYHLIEEDYFNCNMSLPLNHIIEGWRVSNSILEYCKAETEENEKISYIIIFETTNEANTKKVYILLNPKYIFNEIVLEKIYIDIVNRLNVSSSYIVGFPADMLFELKGIDMINKKNVNWYRMAVTEII